MDEEELALKILDRYTALKRDASPEELTDAYFSILRKVRGSSSASYSSTSSPISEGVMELPGVSMELPMELPSVTITSELPTAPEQSPDFSIFEQTTEAAAQPAVPESVGFFDLAINTETLCKTDIANDPVQEKKYISPEEKDMLDDEKYYG